MNIINLEGGASAPKAQACRCRPWAGLMFVATPPLGHYNTQFKLYSSHALAIHSIDMTGFIPSSLMFRAALFPTPTIHSNDDANNHTHH